MSPVTLPQIVADCKRIVHTATNAGATMPTAKRKRRAMEKKGVRAKFSARLAEAMSDAGHIRKRGQMIGPDLYALMEKLQVSREMARRYLAGEGLPEAEKLSQLADWLAVNISWLRDGVGPKHGDKINAEDVARDDDERKLLRYFRRAKPDGRQFIIRTAMVTIVTNGDE